MTYVVIDNSFFQGTNTRCLMQSSYCFLYPDAFFQEIAVTTREKREKCLSKIRVLHSEQNILVLPYIGVLLKTEMQTLNPAGIPSDNIKRNIDLQSFLDSDFDNLDKEQLNAMERTRADIRKDVDHLINTALQLQRTYPKTIQKSHKYRKETCQELREKFSNDSAFLLNFLANFVLAGENSSYRNLSLADLARSGTVGSKWTIFRWIQVRLIYCVDLLEEHGQLKISKITPRMREKFQNHISDMEYVIMGILQNSLATNDRHMMKIFRRLQPNGMVIESLPTIRG